MRDWTLDVFCERLAARTPTPGGGSVAALSGALAASLGAMVARFSKDDPAAAGWDAARSRFLDLIREDSAAYDQVSAVFKLAKDDPARSARLQEALAVAARPPAEGLRAIAAFMGQLAAFAPKARGSVASDLSVAAFEAEAAARGFSMNVRANTSGYKDRAAAAALDGEAAALLEKTLAACRAVREATGG
jgi:formiminotetrahydrofolate cyclodeaminase